jgi:Tol biopolymer transport system component
MSTGSSLLPLGLQARPVLLVLLLAGPIVALALHFRADQPVTAPPTLHGRLLYTYDGGLGAFNLNDGQTTQLVAAPDFGQVSAARWSPDGSRFVYAQFQLRDRRIPVSEVFVADASGDNRVRVLSSDNPSTFYQYPVWGPDAGHIYAVQAAQDFRGIIRVDLASGAAERLTDQSVQFDVSPDARSLVLARFTGTGAVLSLLDLGTGAQRDLVSEGIFDTIALPRFDQSATRIVFAGIPFPGTAQLPSNSLPPRAVESARGDPGPSDPLPPRGGGPGRGGVPDLFEVPTASAHGFPQDLFAVPLDGGTPTRLTNSGLDDPAMAWSPDGGYLAILSSEALQTMNMRDGTRTPFRVPGAYGTVDWSP